MLARSGSGHVQQRKEPPSRARPAAAQPTNRAGPNSYLRGVEDTIRCDCADPAPPRPPPGDSQPLPGRAEGGQGVGSGGWGLTSLLGLPGEAGRNERTSGEVGMNTHPFFSPCPSTSAPPTQSDPGPSWSAPCDLGPLSSSAQCKGVWWGATRQAARDGRNGAVQPPLSVMVWPTELATGLSPPSRGGQTPPPAPPSTPASPPLGGAGQPGVPSAAPRSPHLRARGAPCWSVPLPASPPPLGPSADATSSGSFP